VGPETLGCFFSTEKTIKQKYGWFFGEFGFFGKKM